jgi:hypothetical protein
MTLAILDACSARKVMLASGGFPRIKDTGADRRCDFCRYVRRNKDCFKYPVMHVDLLIIYFITLKHF